MSKYLLYVFLFSSLIPSSSFAMEGKEEQSSLAISCQTSFRPAILEHKERFIISPSITSIQNLRDSFKGVRQGTPKDKVRLKYETAIKNLQEKLTLTNLANAVYLASFFNDSIEKENASYKVFIEGVVKENPYNLINLLGYEDIRRHMAPEVLQQLRSFKDESLTALSRIFNSHDDDFQPNPYRSRYKISEIVSAFIYAYENDFSIHVLTYLLIDIISLNKLSPITDVLNLVDHSNVASMVLRAYAYSSAAIFEMDKALLKHRKSKGGEALKKPEKALGYINKAVSLIPHDHESYGEILRKKNNMSLYLINESVTGVGEDELVESLREEAKHRKLEFSKIVFLSDRVQTLDQRNEILSFCGDITHQNLPEYIQLLLCAQQNDKAYEITLAKKDLPLRGHEELNALWLYLTFKKGNLEAFETSLCDFNNIYRIRYIDSKFAKYINDLSDEVMKSTLSPKVKAHYAYIYNSLNPFGFELASQFGYVEDPILRIFLSLPLFCNHQNVLNDDIYERVRNVLVDSPDAALSLLTYYNGNIDMFRLISRELTNLITKISQKNQDNKKAQVLKKMSEDIDVYSSQVLNLDLAQKRKKPNEGQADQADQKHEIKRLRLVPQESADPRKTWKYDFTAINDGSCNATQEQLEGYKAVRNFVEEMKKNEYISPWEASSALYVIKGYEILHEHNADICKEILGSKTPISYSVRYKVSRDRDIFIHPETSDLNLECRASNFYNILMAAFLYVRDSNDMALKVAFIREAFASHIPCFEARSSHMDRWREDASKRHLTDLQNPETIKTKTAEQNIIDLSNALLRRDEFEVSQVRSQQRLQEVKKRFGHLAKGDDRQKDAHTELSWAFKMLQDYLSKDIQAHHENRKTYASIARELIDILIYKKALDKTIEESDIVHVLNKTLCWDIGEQAFGIHPMEIEEE